MEAEIRLVSSLGFFLVMIGWECFLPRRALDLTRKQRWPVNLGLAFLNMGIIRLTVGGIAYLSAVEAMEKNWGLLHILNAPEWMAMLATLIVLDLVIYGQHIVAHKWMPLWRLHQVHHTDLGFDASTAVRFHPLEIIFSLLAL